MVLGFEIRDPEKTYSGSRIQGSKRHRIPDPGSATLVPKKRGVLTLFLIYSTVGSIFVNLTCLCLKRRLEGWAFVVGSCRGVWFRMKHRWFPVMPVTRVTRTITTNRLISMQRSKQVRINFCYKTTDIRLSVSHLRDRSAGVTSPCHSMLDDELGFQDVFRF
jgi:hypothetical protein